VGAIAQHQEGVGAMSARRGIISIRELSKRFGATVLAVDAVSFDILEGEFFALLGPSGCGKTTLLRMLAGFETPSAGSIAIDGQDMLGIDPNRRPVNMVFQSYAVFPHMTVAQNVGYGLKVVGGKRAEIGAQVAESLALVKMEGYEERMPSQLSGGQLQRVALARALVKRPKVLLLDEPLSALDAKLREAMRLELVSLQHSVGITFVIVTHDQNEALSMADRVAVMEAGKVRQIAPPSELYEFPNCRFVADFIGQMNLFDGRVAGVEGESLLVEVRGLGRIAIPFDGEASGEIGIAVRPEKVRLDGAEPDAGRVRLRGRISEVAYYGNTSHVFLDNETGVPLSVTIQNQARTTAPKVAIGDQLWMSWDPADTLVLTS